MVLHDVPNDAELVKILGPSIRTKALLECNLYIADVTPIPQGHDKGVGKSERKQILK